MFVCEKKRKQWVQQRNRNMHTNGDWSKCIQRPENKLQLCFVGHMQSPRLLCGYIILRIPIEGHMDMKTMNWPQVCEGGSESVVIWCEVEAQTTCRSLTRKVGLKINSVAGLR